MQPYRVLQYPSEHQAFVELLKSEGVHSYLEIGSMYGGSLQLVADALPAGSRMVAVDMPSLAQSKASLQRCVEGLVKRGYDAHVIFGDSTAPQVIEQAKALGPYDCVFIDGGHTLPYVTSDWETYGKMAKCLVAFHDIAWRRAVGWNKDNRHLDISVPQLWEQIKANYRYQEYKMDPTRQDNGIGVLWINDPVVQAG